MISKKKRTMKEIAKLQTGFDNFCSLISAINSVQLPYLILHEDKDSSQSQKPPPVESNKNETEEQIKPAKSKRYKGQKLPRKSAKK